MMTGPTYDFERQVVLFEAESAFREFADSNVERLAATFEVLRISGKYLIDQTVMNEWSLSEIFFFMTILPMFSSFSRVEEERMALVAEFVKFLAEELEEEFRHRLLYKQEFGSTTEDGDQDRTL